MFHSLTGCDRVSFLKGRGKKTAWNTRTAYKDITTTNNFLLVAIQLSLQERRIIQICSHHGENRSTLLVPFPLLFQVSLFKLLEWYTSQNNSGDMLKTRLYVGEIAVLLKEHDEMFASLPVLQYLVHSKSLKLKPKEMQAWSLSDQYLQMIH